VKLAVIGGGSTYTPELADGLGRLAPQVTELVLVDPDEARLAVVGPVSARIMRAHGHQASVRWTSDADDGIDGAAAVLIQLRVGGQAARDRDETWPLDFCCVGQETTGAGGLAKALRTIPLVLEIAEVARRRATSAISRTRGMVRSALARPPAPVVSCPTQQKSSGQVSSRSRAAWPPTRSWISTAAAPSIPSSASLVHRTLAWCPCARMIRADTGPTTASRASSGSTRTSSVTWGASRPRPSASSGV